MGHHRIRAADTNSGIVQNSLRFFPCIVLRHGADIVRNHIDGLGFLLLDHQRYFLRAAVDHRDGIGRHIAGIGRHILQFLFTGAIDLGQVNHRIGIGSVQLVQVGAVALQMQCHRSLSAGNNHQSPFIQIAFAAEHHRHIINGRLISGADRRNDVQPQAKGNDKRKQARQYFFLHCFSPPFSLVSF